MVPRRWSCLLRDTLKQRVSFTSHLLVTHLFQYLVVDGNPVFGLIQEPWRRPFCVRPYSKSEEGHFPASINPVSSKATTRHVLWTLGTGL
ncbi:hypothetical protein I79_022779 [Cricetulus griseus]|uniref:Uncharacterized protein n=1 Tax=Cricetulus griseus TaxID=10029 RepID=G3IG97_CRIGR|nr:hypothetical protein I79_022779 [Cricetulus griseus]